MAENASAGSASGNNGGGESVRTGHVVTIMTRQGCPACDVAIAEAGRICDELDVPMTTADVDGDAELRAEYGDRVPVILVDDVEHGFWKVESDRLRTALRAQA